MKTLINLGIALTASLVSISVLASPKNVCVINFETPTAPQTAIVNKVFAGQPGVQLHNMAIPLDLTNCIRSGAEEIVIIGHALISADNEKGTKPVDLGYFVNLTGDARKQAITNWLASINQQIKDMQPELPFIPHFSDPDEVKKYQNLVYERKELLSFKDSRPYYVVRTLLPQAMLVARAALKEQAAQPNGVTLKKIRLMSCLPDQVLAQYDDLRGLIDDNHITLDVAPKNVFWSFVEGMDVTSPSQSWLRESL